MPSPQSPFALHDCDPDFLVSTCRPQGRPYKSRNFPLFIRNKKGKKFANKAGMLLKTNGRRKMISGLATMSMKKNDLYGSCHDVNEKKGSYRESRG
jgi:hypothetical protein